jgi:hypothetical protein
MRECGAWWHWNNDGAKKVRTRERERKKRADAKEFHFLNLSKRGSSMSLALHGHHILLIATLAFAAAVLTPNWFTSIDKGININVFQICTNSSSCSSCPWIFTLQSNNSISEPSK